MLKYSAHDPDLRIVNFHFQYSRDCQPITPSCPISAIARVYLHETPHTPPLLPIHTIYDIHYKYPFLSHFKMEFFHVFVINVVFADI